MKTIKYLTVVTAAAIFAGNVSASSRMPTEDEKLEALHVRSVPVVHDAGKRSTGRGFFRNIDSMSVKTATQVLQRVQKENKVPPLSKAAILKSADIWKECGVKFDSLVGSFYGRPGDIRISDGNFNVSDFQESIVRALLRWPSCIQRYCLTIDSGVTIDQKAAQVIAWAIQQGQISKLYFYGDADTLKECNTVLDAVKTSTTMIDFKWICSNEAPGSIDFVAGALGNPNIRDISLGNVTMTPASEFILSEALRKCKSLDYLYLSCRVPTQVMSLIDSIADNLREKESKISYICLHNITMDSERTLRLAEAFRIKQTSEQKLTHIALSIGVNGERKEEAMDSLAEAIKEAPIHVFNPHLP